MEETKEEFMQAWHDYPFFVDGVPNIISTDELRQWEDRAAVHGLQVNAEKSYARIDMEEPCWVLLSLEPSAKEGE